jgi:oxygen-independent coproporphyrinogen-3 oxidase
MQRAERAAYHEFSVEVHPDYTTEAHLRALQQVGFNRISLGVQDFDPQVQYIINRPQTFEQTNRVVQWARALGYGKRQRGFGVRVAKANPAKHRNDH